MTAITLCSVTADDIPALAFVARRAIIERGLGDKINTPLSDESSGDEIERLETLFNDNAAVFTKATDGDKIIGFSAYRPREDGIVHLERLYALPHPEKPGRKLMDQFIETMSELHINRIELLPISDQSQEFYKTKYKFHSNPFGILYRYM